MRLDYFFYETFPAVVATVFIIYWINGLFFTENLGSYIVIAIFSLLATIVYLFLLIRKTTGGKSLNRWETRAMKRYSKYAFIIFIITMIIFAGAFIVKWAIVTGVLIWGIFF